MGIVAAEVDAEGQRNRDQARVLATVEKDREVGGRLGDDGEASSPLETARRQAMRQIDGPLTDFRVR